MAIAAGFVQSFFAGVESFFVLSFGTTGVAITFP
jgi:hypothetical protein